MLLVSINTVDFLSLLLLLLLNVFINWNHSVIKIRCSLKTLLCIVLFSTLLIFQFFLGLTNVDTTNSNEFYYILCNTKDIKRHQIMKQCQLTLEIIHFLVLLFSLISADCIHMHFHQETAVKLPQWKIPKLWSH